MFLAPGSFGHIANIVKGYAIAVGVVFAIWYFWSWARHSLAWREADQRAKTQKIWSAFLKTKFDLGQEATHAGGAGQPVADLNFTAYLLSVAEEILILSPTDDWRATLKQELASHKPILAHDDFKHGPGRGCSRALAALIEDVIRTG